STLSLVAGARQLTEMIALGGGLYATQSQGCLDALCDWASRGAGATIRLAVRPWRWVTFAASGTEGLRYRPRLLAAPLEPDAWVEMPPARMRLTSGSVSAAFYW